MYLKTAIINNYQSHKKTVLNLHSGVNAIIGLSGHGKSAIMRSIRWNILNKNEDRSFRSRWGGATDIELVFADGPSVSRVQDKGNAYYLLDPTNDIDEEYKAFKTEIPDDIRAALNMDSINIQSQFDTPFLLADSGGDVAKTLNKIANLTDIDTSISNIRKLVLANSKEISTTEDLISDLTKQQESFKYLLQMETDVLFYEQLTQELADVTKRHHGLCQLVMAIERDLPIQNEIDVFLTAEPELEAALTLQGEHKTLTERIRGLAALCSTLERDALLKAELDTFLKAEPEMLVALDLMKQEADIDYEIQGLARLIKMINLNKVQLASADKNIAHYENEFNKLMPEGPCLLCGRVK